MVATEVAGCHGEAEDAFRRSVRARVRRIGRRVESLVRGGWDINGVAMAHDDAGVLAEGSRRVGLGTLAAGLDRLRDRLAPRLAGPSLPDQADDAALLALVDELAAALPAAAACATPDGKAIGDPARIERPPPGFWRAWAADAPPPTPLVPRPVPRPPEPGSGSITSFGASLQFEPMPDSDGNSWHIARHGEDEDGHERPAEMNIPDPDRESTGRGADAGRQDRVPDAQMPGVDGRDGDRAVPGAVDDSVPGPGAGTPEESLGAVIPDTPRVYHLTDGNGLGCEVAQGMEQAGWETELLEDAAELRELLAALPPDLVLIDAAFLSELEDVGAVLRATRQRTGVRLPLAAIVDDDALATRLAARRAGADALIVSPSGAEEVLAILQSLLLPPEEPPYRVLIVEDDRSQALFAESILRNAGMETAVVDDPFEVIPALQRFQPDMVLMDLHMPRCNGMELTGLIRDHERFLHLPIVFLSGEADQDIQFEALDAGGDDFLAKPVRPRHLISAVQNRVRRARALSRRSGAGEPLALAAAASGAGAAEPPPAVVGLSDRAPLMAQVADAIGSGQWSGAVLFLEVDSGAQLRDRLGLSALEQLLAAAGRVIVGELDKDGMVARFGDASFLAFVPGADEAGLPECAQRIRTALDTHRFEAGEKPIALRFSIGAVALQHKFADLGELLNAAGGACREARTRERGVHVHVPAQRPEIARERALVGRLREALAGKPGLELVYQPIVAVQGGDDVQYQTLLRMREDDGRLMPAGEVIPIAERYGLMVEIDRWVVDSALRVILSETNPERTIRLFVTQATATLCAQGQADWLMQRLAGANAPPETLIVEMRADDAIVHEAGLTGFCRAASAAGVRFCLSRFDGSRQAMALLDRLPLSYVKLAGKYLEANTAPEIRDELTEIVEAAHKREMLVIGNRVEDAQSAATLWVSGIDFIQGNLVQQADSGLSFDFHSTVL